MANFGHGGTPPTAPNRKHSPIAIPESPIPPAALMQLQQDMLHIREALKAQAAATLAASIVTASGRPHSIQQALDIARDIQMAMYPSPQSGFYQEWAKTKEEKLNKVHGAA
jgi:hypothetical protein